MTPQLVDELAPTGTLRAALNLANFLLTSGKNAAGEPEGVAPDLARAIADRLSVPVSFVCFDRPRALADAVGSGIWDIGFIGAEPARAETIAFTAAYSEIEATYLLPAGSMLTSTNDVDRSGVRIAVSGGSAYDLWLTRNIKHAELVRARSPEDSFRQFADGRLDALAGLRPRLISDVKALPGARILDDRFTAVQQAIGTARSNHASAEFLNTFVKDAKRTGLVASFIGRHNVQGLSVAREQQ
jgi:polar amino acid transport system substrate-binding protein